MLAVVGGGGDHGALLGDRQAVEQLGGVSRAVCDEDAGVAVRLGVYADDGLAVEVLGHIGDQSVLSDDDDDVVGSEQEPV